MAAHFIFKNFVNIKKVVLISVLSFYFLSINLVNAQKNNTFDILDNRPANVNDYISRPVFKWNVTEKALPGQKKGSHPFVLLNEKDFQLLTSEHKDSALKLFSKQKQINEFGPLVKDAAWSINLVNNQAIGKVSFNLSKQDNYKRSIPLFSADFSITGSSLLTENSGLSDFDKIASASNYSMYIDKYNGMDFVFLYLENRGDYKLVINFLLPVNINPLGGSISFNTCKFINGTIKLTVENPGVSVVFPENFRPLSVLNPFKKMAEYNLLCSNKESIFFSYTRTENFEQISTPITLAEAEYVLLKNRALKKEDHISADNGGDNSKDKIKDNKKKDAPNNDQENDESSVKPADESKISGREAVKKLKPKINTWVHSINDISNSRITSINVLKIKVDVMPVKTLTFKLTGKTEILKFECLQTHGFDIINSGDSKKIVLTFQNSFKGTAIIGITAVSDFDDQKSIFPEKIIVENSTSQIGFLGFCSSSNLSLERGITENIQRIDPNELDNFMRIKASAPIYFAYKYNSLPYRIEFRAKKFKSLDSDLSPMAAKVCYAHSRLDTQAGLITELNIKMVNASSQNIKLDLLNDIEVMSIKVADNPVAWSKEKHNNKNRYLIPLIRSESILKTRELKDYNLLIKYRVPAELFTAGGKAPNSKSCFLNQELFNIDLFLPDIPVERLNWTLKAPEKTEMIYSSSHVYTPLLPFFRRIFSGLYYTFFKIFKGYHKETQVLSFLAMIIFLFIAKFFLPGQEGTNKQQEETNKQLEGPVKKSRFKKIVSIFMSLIFLAFAFSMLPGILNPGLYSSSLMDALVLNPVKSLIRPLDIYVGYLFENNGMYLVQDKIQIIKNMHFYEDSMSLTVRILPSWKFGLSRFAFFIAGFLVLLLFKRMCSNANVLLSITVILIAFLALIFFSKSIKSADFYFSLGSFFSLIVFGFLKILSMVNKYKIAVQGMLAALFLLFLLMVSSAPVRAAEYQDDMDLWEKMPCKNIDLGVLYNPDTINLKSPENRASKKIIMKLQDYECMQWICNNHEAEIKRIENQEEFSMAVCLESELTFKETEESMNVIFSQKILKTGSEPVKFLIADSKLIPMKIISMPGVSEKTKNGIFSNILYPGIYKSVISGVIPVKKDPSTNRKTLSFNIPKCVSGKVNMFFPLHLIKPEISSALNLISDYSNDKTSLTAYIKPSETLTISWYDISGKPGVDNTRAGSSADNNGDNSADKSPDTGKEPAKIQKARTLLTTDILCSINENFMKISNIFHIQVNYSPVEYFDFEIPENINITSIDCPDMEKYKINLRNDKKILTVFLLSPLKGSVKILIEGEKNFKTLPESIIVPLIILKNNGRNKITASIASESNIRVKKITEKGLKPADVASHLAMFEKNQNSKILFSYIYASENIDFKLGLENFVPLPMPATIIDSSDHNFLKRDDPDDLLESIYTLKNNGAQFLKLRIPENYKIISAHVSDNPVIPSQNSQDEILIPLIKSDFAKGDFKSFLVKILFRIKSVSKSVAHIQLPLPDADCGTTNLKIYESINYSIRKTVTDMNDYPLSVKPINNSVYSIKNSSEDIGQSLDLPGSHNLIDKLFDNTMISGIRSAKIDLVKNNQEERVFSQKYYSPGLSKSNSLNPDYPKSLLRVESSWMNPIFMDILELLLLYYGVTICFLFNKLIKNKRFYFLSFVIFVITLILFCLENSFPGIYESFAAGVFSYPAVFIIIKILSENSKASLYNEASVKKVFMNLVIVIFTLALLMPENANALSRTKIKNISSINKFNNLFADFSTSHSLKSLSEILEIEMPLVLTDHTLLSEMQKLTKTTFNGLKIQDKLFFESDENEKMVLLEPSSLQSCHLKGGFINNVFLGEVQMFVYKHSPGPEYIKLTGKNALPFLTYSSAGPDIVKQTFDLSDSGYLQRITGRGLIKITNNIMCDLKSVKNSEAVQKSLNISLPEALINSFEIALFDNTVPKAESAVITSINHNKEQSVIRGYSKTGEFNLLWLQETPVKTEISKIKESDNIKESDKGRPLFLCDSALLYTFSENLLTGYAAVKLRIADKSTDHIDIIIPEGTYITEIEGSRLQFWEKTGAYKTRAVFNNKINGFVDLNIKFEKIFTPDTKCIDIPVPEIFSAKRDGGFIALESSWDYFIEPIKTEGIKLIPLQSIPEFMSTRAKRPFLGTYKYFSHPLDLKVNITAITNMEKNLVTSQADNVTIDFIPGDKDDYIAKVSMNIRNKTKQFLKLSLPRDSQIVQYITNNKLSKPSWSSKSENQVLLPIEREIQKRGSINNSNNLSFIYKGKFQGIKNHPFLWFFDIPIPKMDIPCENFQVNFHCPDKKVYSHDKNNPMMLKNPIAWFWPHTFIINFFEESVFYNNTADPVSIIYPLVILFFLIMGAAFLRKMFLKLISWFKRAAVSRNKYLRYGSRTVLILFLILFLIILISPVFMPQYTSLSESLDKQAAGTAPEKFQPKGFRRLNRAPSLECEQFSFNDESKRSKKDFSVRPSGSYRKSQVQQKVIVRSARISETSGISGILPVGMSLPGSRNIIRFYKKFLPADTFVNPMIMCTSENFQFVFGTLLFLSGIILSVSIVFIFKKGISLLTMTAFISSGFYSFICFKLFPPVRPVLLYAVLTGLLCILIRGIVIAMNRFKTKKIAAVIVFLSLSIFSGSCLAFNESQIQIPLITPVTPGQGENIFLPLLEYRDLKRAYHTAGQLETKYFEEIGYISRELTGTADLNNMYLTYRGSFIKHNNDPVSIPLISGDIHINKINLANENRVNENRADKNSSITAIPLFPVNNFCGSLSPVRNAYYINFKDSGIYTFHVEMVLKVVTGNLKPCTPDFEIPRGIPIPFKIHSKIDDQSVKALNGINMSAEKNICSGILKSGHNNFFFIKNRAESSEINDIPGSLKVLKDEKKKKISRVTVKCFEKYLIEDIYISGKIQLKIDVSIEPLTELQFKLPPLWQLLNISSPNEIDYRIEDDITIYFTDGFTGIRDIYLDLEKNLSASDNVIELPLICPEKIIKIDTFTGIVNNTQDLINIDNLKSKNIFNISPSSLPFEFSDLIHNAALAVQSKGFDRQLFIIKNSSGESHENTLACNETLYKSLIDSSLTEKTETTWWIANLSSPFLNIKIPADSRLISALVDNKPIQPKILDDKIMIPLIKSEKTSQGLRLFNVTILCERNHSDINDFSIEFPCCELFSPASTLTLILDNSMEMIKTFGHFDYRSTKTISQERSIYNKLSSRVISGSYKTAKVKRKNYLYKDQITQAQNLESNFSKLYDLKASSQHPGPLNIELKPLNINGIIKDNIYILKGQGVVENINPLQTVVLVNSGRAAVYRFLLFFTGITGALLLLTGITRKRALLIIIGLIILTGLFALAVFCPWLTRYFGGGILAALILIIIIYAVLLPEDISDALEKVKDWAQKMTGLQ